MEIAATVAIVGVGLLLAELILPTGGVLAVIGAIGLIAAGVVSLEQTTRSSEEVGAALITVGVLALITFLVVARKVVKAQTDEQVRSGTEEFIGREVDVRESIDPLGQVRIEGALWRARSTKPGVSIPVGSRVTVEEVDGLTLVVKPALQEDGTSGEPRETNSPPGL